jgi:hypothetical protein
MLAIDYGQLMAKKVKEVLGRRSSGYTFATYPVDNFGLATAYEDKADPSRELCATWDCLGVSDDEQVEAMSAKDQVKLRISTLQYADTGDGPSLKLSDDEKNSIGLKALLPQLLRVLSLAADFSTSKNVTTTLTMGPVTIRTLRRKEMLDHLKSQDAHPLEKTAFEKRKLILVYSDIVVSSMTLDLKLDATASSDLEAKLEGSLQGKVGQVVGKNSSLSFKVARANKGDYSFEINKPVILAVYTKRQPAAGELGTTGWSRWSDFDVGKANRALAESINLGDLR